jgi:L-alanine-DL-glutamate epimerase-like enolase superfamily enzyme
MNISLIWQAMNRSVRNLGRPGVGLMAISAVDHALWDLKSRLLGLPVALLIGVIDAKVPAYGSGGFTSYDVPTLARHMQQFARQGFRAVKIKVGRNPEHDSARVSAVREAIGPDIDLMVDANGAYERKQAGRMIEQFERYAVTWFEEPVSSDDLEGLRQLRNQTPAGMDITAGEYGWDGDYFQRLLDSHAVDVVQIDSTRCGGFTGFLQCAQVAGAHRIPVSAHCAPHLHAHVCASIRSLRHVEYFHDHARIEHLFFDGLPKLIDGSLELDLSRPGLGLDVRLKDVERYRVS